MTLMEDFGALALDTKTPHSKPYFFPELTRRPTLSDAELVARGQIVEQRVRRLVERIKARDALPLEQRYTIRE